jgi:hypothetical protein
MFGFISVSKSAVRVLSAAALGTVILASAAMAHGHSGGNAFQIPSSSAFAMYWGDENAAQPPTPVIRHHSLASYSAGQSSAPAVRHTPVPTVVQRSSTNPNCVGGYSEMDRSEAANGVGMVMTCHS